jgi:hypothetical protein
VSRSVIIVPAHFDRLHFAHTIVGVLPNLCVLLAETRKEEAEDIPGGKSDSHSASPKSFGHVLQRTCM